MSHAALYSKILCRVVGLKLKYSLLPTPPSLLNTPTLVSSDVEYAESRKESKSKPVSMPKAARHTFFINASLPPLRNWSSCVFPYSFETSSVILSAVSVIASLPSLNSVENESVGRLISLSTTPGIHWSWKSVKTLYAILQTSCENISLQTPASALPVVSTSLRQRWNPISKLRSVTNRERIPGKQTVWNVPMSSRWLTTGVDGS